MATARRPQKPPNRGEKSRRIPLEELAAQQGVNPIFDPSKLGGNFWPEDEDMDEFLATLRMWRQDRQPDPD